MSYSPDFLATAIKMFSALLLVLGILLGSFYVLRRLSKRDGAALQRNLIHVVDRTYIGVKKSITLVEVSGEFLVLGVTSDRISFLTRIEDQDRIQTLKSNGPAGTPKSFSNHLNQLLAKVRVSKSR